MSCAVLGDADGDMERDYYYSSARDPAELDSAESIGVTAATRVLRRLGARKIKTTRAPVLFIPELARGFIARADCAAETLQRFNPRIKVQAVDANISEANADTLVEQADIVFGCAPLFEERFAMNAACVRQRKPLIDCAMYAMEGRVISVFPGQTPCLNCLYPEVPPHWKRRFPVIGAVSAMVAQIGAIEGIKHLANLDSVARQTMLTIDARTMRLDHIQLAPRRESCGTCGSA